MKIILYLSAKEYEKCLNGFFNLEILIVEDLIQTLDVTCIPQLAMYIHSGLALRDQIKKK